MIFFYLFHFLNSIILFFEYFLYRIIHCKNKQLQSKNIVQFIITSIKLQKQKYSYGYKMNNTRLTNQIIMLPIDNLNNPDYKLMETYIQNQKLQKYNYYLNFLFVSL